MAPSRSTPRPALTLLHGFMGGRSSWEAVLPELPRDVALAIPLLPGHGPSPLTPTGRGFQDNVDALLPSVAGPSASAGGTLLVGYSMGARVALALALAWPDYFSEVIAVGADLGLVDGPLRTARVEEDEARARFIEARGVQAFVDAWEALPLFATQKRARPAALAAQRETRLAHTPQGLAFALRTLGTGSMPDLRSALSRAPLPITFVAGREDPKFLALAEEGAALAPRGRLVVVPSSGHNVPLEAPRVLAQALRERLDAATASSTCIENVKASIVQKQSTREEPRHE